MNTNANGNTLYVFTTLQTTKDTNGNARVLDVVRAVRGATSAHHVSGYDSTIVAVLKRYTSSDSSAVYDRFPRAVPCGAYQVTPSEYRRILKYGRDHAGYSTGPALGYLSINY